nr:hypothetical protein [Tanacetum cinerariifolium]
DEDPKEDPVDYPVDGGDDGDDEEGSSEDDEDDDMDIKDDEEEEHPAPADSSEATPPPHPAYRMTARISIPAPLPVPAWEDRPEVTLPPRKRLGSLLVLDMRKVGYGITDSWDEIVETLQGAPISTDTELGGYMRKFKTRVMRDTRDRRAHAYTRHLMKIKARLSREAWVRSMDASDLARGEKKMAPKQTTTSIADQETTNTTSVTNAHLQAMINQGVTTALAVRDALRSTNGDDSYNSGTGVRRQNELLVNVLTLTFSSVNNYTSKAQRELLVFPNGLKEWSLFSISVTVQLKIRSALLCGRMFTEESDKIEKYIGGLPDMIHGSVVASKPKTMQEAIEIATKLMDKKIRTFAERETASKRKFENTSRSTQNQQQQPSKRQNTGRVYTAASGEK